MEAVVETKAKRCSRVSYWGKNRSLDSPCCSFCPWIGFLDKRATEQNLIQEIDMNSIDDGLYLPVPEQEKRIRNLGLIAYWFVFINLFLGVMLLMFSPSALSIFLREDSIAETSGALLLLFTGIALFYCVLTLYRQEKPSNRSRKIKLALFFLAAMAFLWAAGEEISWGQRIFGIATPRTLAEINQQKELNLHNLNTLFFNNGLETIILLAILVPTVCRLKGRDRIFGLILPSYSLILGFQLVSCYVTYHYMKPQDYLAYLVLVALFFEFHRKQDWHSLERVLLSTSLVIFIAVVNISLRESFPSNGPREFREYLFSFLCFVYSLELVFDIKSQRSGRNIHDPGNNVRLPNQYIKSTID